MIELRELKDTNFDEIKTLFKSVFMAPPWNDDWSDDHQLTLYLQELMEPKLSIVYGLFVDNSMVGISLGRIKHWCGGTEYFIEEFFIKTEMQGKGLGRKFITLIENAICQKGVKQIFLMTQRNVPAYEFYKKSGFTEIPEHASFFKELGNKKMGYSSEPEVANCGCIYG